MKRLLLSLLIACCMSVSPLFAATVTQRAGIADLIKKLQNNAVSANDVWGEIKKLNINPNDYNDPEYQRMNRLAIDLLNKSGFTINNKRILLETNLGSLPTSSKPMRVMARGEVSEEPTIKPSTLPRKGITEPKAKEIDEPTEPTVPGTGTVQDAIVSLEDLKRAAQQATSLEELYTLYKTFYKYQDRYAGLSGVPKTSINYVGLKPAQQRYYIFWDKTIKPSDQSKFAEAAQDTLKALMDKEFELRGVALKNGDIVKATQDEVKQILDEMNASNPFGADGKLKISKKDYETILQVRGELLSWQKIKQQPDRFLTSADIKAIKEVIRESRSKEVQPYIGEFARSIAINLENYINSDQVQAQLKKLGEAEAGIDAIKKDIDALNAEINKAIETVLGKPKSTGVLGFGTPKFEINGEITPIAFKDKFTNIDNMIKKLDPGVQKTAQPLADQTFALFAKYVGFAQSAQSQLWGQYWKQPNWKQQTQDLAVKIDRSEAAIKDLRNDYKAFPSYIYTASGDDSTAFMNTLQAVAKEKRLAIVRSLLIEFQTKLLAMKTDLARGYRMVKVGNKEEKASGIYAFDNFVRYTKFFKVVLAPTSGLLDKDDKDQARDTWNLLQAQYAQHVADALKAYRNINDLAHLHELSTGQSVKIATAMDTIIPSAPFTAIASMLGDLRDYLATIDGRDGYDMVTREVTINLCYILAAFDSFGYTLFTGTVKADPRTWRVWFWGLLGYKEALNKEAFEKKNKQLVQDWLNTIARAIQLYENTILNNLAPEPVVITKYDIAALNIIDQLNSYGDYAKEANLLAVDGKNYRYDLTVTSPITIAGIKEPVRADIESITAVHKKQHDYKTLVASYNKILADAYGDPEWQKQANTDMIFQKEQELAKKNDTELTKLRDRVIQLENQLSMPTTTTAQEITDIRSKIENAEEDWNKLIGNLQKQFNEEIGGARYKEKPAKQ